MNDRAVTGATNTRYICRNVHLLLAVAVVLSLALPDAARAVATFQPYAAVRYENNSNVFAESDTVAAASGGKKDDSLLSYIGGFRGKYDWGRQQLIGGFSASRDNYVSHTELNHTEYDFNGALDWTLTSLLDGIVGYKQQRRMAPFEDKTASTSLQIEDDKTVNASMALHITNDWRLEPQVKYHDLKSPQTGFPDFGLREKTGGFGIKYVGVSHLSFGLEGQYLDGQFRGSDNIVPKYIQRTGRFAAHYNINNFSVWDLAVGYTSRDQGASDNSVGAATGQLIYKRQLTGKTTVRLQVSREVNSYVTAGSSEIDTGGQLEVNWQATGKTSFSFLCTYTHSKFEGEILPGSISTGRKDKFRIAEVNANWMALRWLSVRPYLRYQKRDSNLNEFTFDSTQVGIEIRAVRPER